MYIQRDSSKLFFPSSSKFDDGYILSTYCIQKAARPRDTQPQTTTQAISSFTIQCIFSQFGTFKSLSTYLFYQDIQILLNSFHLAAFWPLIVATSMYKNTEKNTKNFTEKNTEKIFCIFFPYFFLYFYTWM